MTKEEFIKRYAFNSGITIKKFYELGLDAKPCNCGYSNCDYSNCEGWQIYSRRLND